MKSLNKEKILYGFIAAVLVAAICLIMLRLRPYHFDDFMQMEDDKVVHVYIANVDIGEMTLQGEDAGAVLELLSDAEYRLVGRNNGILHGNLYHIVMTAEDVLLNMTVSDEGFVYIGSEYYSTDVDDFLLLLSRYYENQELYR